MKTIIAIIEKSSEGGYGIYAKDKNVPLTGFGLAEAEAKEDFESLIEEQAEYYKEKTGVYPDWYSTDIKIEYRYDMSAFFMSFPFINATELAKSIGINPSLMRKYKSGIASASDKQKNMIQQKFDDIVNKLGVVKF
jgi:hypothetical protein